MNTISSLGQTMTTDGQYIARPTTSYKSTGKTSSVENIIISPTGNEVAENLEKSAADIKKSAQQLQKLSDMVMGRKLHFNVNNELGSVVVKIVDSNTNQVIKEIPSADMQKIKINIRKAIGIIFDDVI